MEIKNEIEKNKKAIIGKNFKDFLDLKSPII